MVNTIKRGIRTVLSMATALPGLRNVVTVGYNLRQANNPWLKAHPFDHVYGTVTNGALPSWMLGIRGSGAYSYAGCQPSCVRHALEQIPDKESFTFVDLGCGKGRALILASEFPFRQILGVEMSDTLLLTARRNIAIVRQNHPHRPPIDLVLGDVTKLNYPLGNLVVFIYHSFDTSLLVAVLAQILQVAAQSNRTIFLVYENPAHGDIIDANPQFTRWFADLVPGTDAERLASPDEEEAVVIWQTGNAYPPRPNAARSIVFVSNMRATFDSNLQDIPQR